MSGMLNRARTGRWQQWIAGLIMVTACATPSARGQTETPAGSSGGSNGSSDSGIVQTGCSTCGSGLLGAPPTPGPVGTCGCGDCCYAGRKQCGNCCNADTVAGRMFGGIIDCICCPDPCYEPHWIAAADSAFFVDAARPVSQMRLRWDTGWNLPQPDRAEYFWARADGKGKGPMPDKTQAAGVHIFYRDITSYTEVAVGKFSTFVEMPYRQVGEKDDLVYHPDHSGFADMNTGVKSLLLDCELLQVGTQFKTFIPVGSPGKGLGTGHVSLEPSLLVTLKLTPVTYFQSQTAYWIPIGGDPAFQGPVFHYHMAVNHVLWHFCENVQLIGTAGINGWEIMGGANTDTTTANPDGARPMLSAKDFSHIFTAGPGARLVICDKIDFGVGSAFALSHHHFADELVRAEFRWRY